MSDAESCKECGRTIDTAAEKDKCPVCKRGMLLFHSYRIKACVDCRIVYSWDLDPGQFPLIQHQR